MSKVIPELWAHQKEAAMKIAQMPVHDGYALFMEVGTGKTPTAVTGYRYLCARHQRLLRCIIFAPKVVLENWRREIDRFSNIPRDKVTVLTGTAAKRKKLFKERGVSPHIFIANYETLSMPALAALYMSWEPEVLIFDESHRLKNPKAKRTRVAIQLSDTALHKIPMTGTPVLDGKGLDIWSQYRIMDGGATFDVNFFAFRARHFEDKKANMPSQVRFEDWQPRQGTAELFNKLIYQKASRVMKSECLDLPPIVRQRVDVGLTEDQASMYQQMRDEYIAYLDDKACVASIALTKGLRLQQIVSGFFVDDNGKEHAYEGCERLEALEELLQDITPQSKVIVWTNFRHSYAGIMGVCDRIRAPYRCIFGGMTAKDLQQAVDDFQQDESVRVMIANPAAGGTGVTLTAASVAIYFNRSFNLEHYLQSQARNHRGGSEIHDKITYYDLVAAGTIDDVIIQALERKENLAENILRIKELLQKNMNGE